MCSGIKVTCSLMMNCHVIICINVCNWFTHLQPELYVILMIPYYNAYTFTSVKECNIKM